MLRKTYLIALLAPSIPAMHAQEPPGEVNLKDKLYNVGWMEQTNA